MHSRASGIARVAELGGVSRGQGFASRADGMSVGGLRATPGPQKLSNSRWAQAASGGFNNVNLMSFMIIKYSIARIETCLYLFFKSINPH